VIEINHRVDEWIRLGLKALHDERFVQADLDELRTEWDRTTAAPDSLALFATIARRVREASPSVLALLVLPLAPTATFRRDPPDFDRLLESRWAVLQPPGFYLTQRELWADWGDGEDYLRRLHPESAPLPDMDYFYRVHRDEEASSRGWEFEREFIVRPAA
jgi:hypothetical protein